MGDRIQKLPNRTVGEDILLTFAFTRGSAALPISAAIVSIKLIEPEQLVVTGANITLTSENTGEYLWHPTLAGDYLIEAHSLHGDGIDSRSAKASIHIEEKIGPEGPFVAGEDGDPPEVLGYLHLPGSYEVDADAAVGDLVAITAEGVATSYATRGALTDDPPVTPVAASGVVIAKYDDTHAQLALLAVLDSFTGLTPGAPIYLGLDGAISQTRSTTEGELDQCVGVALTETRAVLWTVDHGELVASPTAAGGTPTTANKAMAASLTTADFQEACATAIAAKPPNGGMVHVLVEGVQQELGDGVRTKDCYFSADAGVTARAIAAIEAGDKLYWVGSVAGFQLATTMRVDLNYNV